MGRFAITGAGGQNVTDAIDIDAAFHTMTTSVTKTATMNEFSVISSFAGVSTGTYTVTNAALYSAPTVYTLIFSQGQTNVGGVAIDSLSVDIIPEPSTALLGCIGTMALLRRRRA